MGQLSGLKRRLAATSPLALSRRDSSRFRWLVIRSNAVVLGKAGILRNAVILSKAKDLLVLHLDRSYYVYLMASYSRVLYVGVASDLVRRVFQHKHGMIAGFTRKYRVDRLAYYEETRNSRAAVAREREMKGWTL